MTVSSAELAPEADASRERLANALDQLRERLVPQHLIDEMFERVAGPGGQSVVHRMESVIRDHPLPMLFLGVGGVLWMKSAPRRTGERNGQALPPVSPAEMSLKENLASVSQSFADSAYQRIRTSVSATLDEYAKSTTEGVEAATERISGTLGGTLDKTVSTVASVIQKHPLLSSVVAVALGTALGRIEQTKKV